MRIMIDTNVVISALLKQGSVPDIVLHDVCENHELILCDHIISEIYAVAKRRFSNIYKSFTRVGRHPLAYIILA